jgi:hypothetical protein
MVESPPATGQRVAWAELPAAVRTAVEHRLGGPVAAAVTQPGGFSPGVAARLRLANGDRAFVKAVSAAGNPESPGIHRAEAAIAAALPSSAPVPRFLDVLEMDGWVVLLFEDVPGRLPATPWDPAELTRVLAAMDDLARVMTPSPCAAPPVAERFADTFNGWRELAVVDDDLSDLDPWAVAHLSELAELEAGWTADGETLAHADIRADNILLTGDRVVFVDWPWAARAAPWFDLVLFLPSVGMQGGPDPETLFTAHPLGAAADPAAVSAVLAGLTGFFLSRGRRPDPPGLPTVRAFQRAQGAVALTWLRNRLGQIGSRSRPR